MTSMVSYFFSSPPKSIFRTQPFAGVVSTMSLGKGYQKSGYEIKMNKLRRKWLTMEGDIGGQDVGVV